METTVSRRALLTGSAVTVAAGVAGYLVAHRSSYAKQERAGGGANGYGAGPPSKQELTTLSAVPVGGGVVLGRKNVVVTRDSSGAVHAFSATCTHQGCQVTTVKDGQIICPCHGSRFDASTGDVVRGPAAEPLPAVSVTVQGDVVYAG
jgi:Rieske Fe-S protein